MEHKGYSVEAKHIRLVYNWRRAYNERGLTVAQCSKWNNDFVDYILDDLMPWHKEDHLRDFSLLEVNRYYLQLDIIMTTFLSGISEALQE